MIGELLAGLNILEKLGKFWAWMRGKQTKPTETIAARFVRLFESHGVHRNQIPRFFGYGLTLKDVQDDDALLAKLDETTLDAACTLFAVRREWLDGAESKVYAVHHEFYKHPEAFVAFLETLKAQAPCRELGGLLLAPLEKRHAAEALLVMHETIGYIGDKAIERYHLCNFSSYTYWKTMAYLTACVAIAWKRDVCVYGLRMPMKAIHDLATGEMLLDQRGEGCWRHARDRWEPEDMALKPEVFLRDIEPEQNDFGIKAGLGLWLSLEEQCFMDTGIGALNTSPRQRFQQELAKHSSQSEA